MVAVPSEEALSNARARLGAEPLRLLFWRVAGFAARPGRRGRGGGGFGWCHWTARRWTRRMSRRTGSGRRAVDQDADGRRLRGAFPQVRLLALAECGTRALVAAVHGTFATGEKTLARELLGTARRGDAVPGGPELRLLGAVARCGGDRGAAAVAYRRVVHAAGG